MDRPIRIIGARSHNLRNISVSIPRNKIVVVTGVSGSGKSSLVFDTLYTEAQRQLLETFSAFERGRLSKLSRPDVDEIRDLSPVIVIDQKPLGRNPRSTVGTATEIYTYLRLLFSRCGEPRIGESIAFSFNNPAGMCPRCRGLGQELKFDVDALVDWDLTLAQGAIRHRHFTEGRWLLKVVRNSNLFDFDKPLKKFSPQEINLLLYSEKTHLKDNEGNRFYNINFEGIVTGIKRRTSGHEGAARGSSVHDSQYFRFVPCGECGGSRLQARARSVSVQGRTIPELVSLELADLREFLRTVRGPLATPIVRRTNELLGHLVRMGIGYVSLNQSVSTLSGGESQRIKMARQLGCDLVGLVYVLDEPSIGLHQRDIAHLLDVLKDLRDKGNSVIVVEHDPAVIERADYIIDLGPGAGRLGGQVTFEGTAEALKASDTVTGRYLKRAKDKRPQRRRPSGFLKIKNTNLHNLKNVTVDIPTGVFVCVTGVAGSGKSTLIHDVFVREHSEAIVVDQSPVVGSIRSNPATYTEVFGLIRKEFARATSQPPGLFSFNSAGACPECKGHGRIEVEMHFLDAVSIVCDKCEGRRYLPEVLDLRLRGKNIAEVLALTAAEAFEFFPEAEIRRRLQILLDVGLEYLQLGQPLGSLSGGESQRIKLAAELFKKGHLYVMDEPTVGLHMADIEKLLRIIDRLVEAGNTVIVIEHNLDVIRNADWVIDLGPEGGKRGGEVVAQGTPEDVAGAVGSYTGRYLKRVL
jgi:excinuclease UvrABC ATPase subunit